MFGTLKPHTCRLGCERVQDYESFYCGLCKSLGDHFGQVTRALLSYDAVFLALVADGLLETPAEPDRCRCPILPVVFRPTVRPDSPAMRYAAAMQMLLADQWLADRAEGGTRTAKAARPWLSGNVIKARAILSDLGISLDDLDGFEHEQSRREIPGITGPRAAAEPTASALSRVFSRMAHLPGATEAARSPEGRAALASFGRHLGSAIYLIDALDDLAKDHASGDFNPCVSIRQRDRSMRVSWPRIELAWSLLHDDLAALDELSASLPLLRHRDLVRSVVAIEMRRLAREAGAKAHAYALAEESRRARRPRSWPVRIAAAVATGFVFLWMWILAIPSVARGGPPPRRGPAARDAGAHDAGADAGRGSVVPPSWVPRLPASPPAQPETETPKGPSAPTPSATGRPGGDNPTEPRAKPKKPGGTTPPAKPGSGGGGSCNPCGGCNKVLSDFCGSCFKGCNICDGCCNSCKDCSNCGNGCNNCGNCCNGCNGCNNCGNCGGGGCCK